MTAPPRPSALRQHLLLCAALCTALCVVIACSFALPPDPSIPEVLVWGGYQHALLSRPSDPSGAPQFMSGTAFRGPGWTAGVGLSWRFLPWLGAGVDALLSQTSGEGFEEVSGAGAWSRYLTLHRFDLRLPLLVHLGWRTDAWGVDGLLGAEVLVPLSASAQLSEDGVAASEQLFVKVSAQATAGLLWGATGRVQLTKGLDGLLTARVCYLPGVGTTSTDRFSGFESPENPGTLQVAFDWQASVLLGLAISLDP